MSVPSESVVIVVRPPPRTVRIGLTRADPHAAFQFFSALGLGLVVRFRANEGPPFLMECPGLALTICEGKEDVNEPPTFLRFDVVDLDGTVNSLVAHGGMVVAPREFPRPANRAVVHDGHRVFLVLFRKPVSAMGRADTEDEPKGRSAIFNRAMFGIDDGESLRLSLRDVARGAAVNFVCCAVVFVGLALRSTARSYSFLTVATLFVCIAILVGVFLMLLGKGQSRWFGDARYFVILDLAAIFDFAALAALIAGGLATTDKAAAHWSVLAGIAAACGALAYLIYLAGVAQLIRRPAYRRITLYCGAALVVAAIPTLWIYFATYPMSYGLPHTWNVLALLAGAVTLWLAGYYFVLRKFKAMVSAGCDG